MANVEKNTKSLVNVDWTGTEGETPFYVPPTDVQGGYYAVAVDSGVTHYSQLHPGDFSSTDIALAGTAKILEFYNKIDSRNGPFESADSNSHYYRTVTRVGALATIPGFRQSPENAVSGTYIPIRPNENIKLLVTIPEVDANSGFEFSSLVSSAVVMPIGAYDEIQINTYNLSKKAQNISKLLKKYDKESKNFQGHLYNFSFAQSATSVENFASVLAELVIGNKFSFSDDQSDLIMIGANINYTPLYAQINQGEGFIDLGYDFNQFKNSKFVDGNTLFIYKNLDEINKLSLNIGAGVPSATTTINSLGWEDFLNKYIQHPAGSVEHTSVHAHKAIEKTRDPRSLWDQFSEEEKAAAFAKLNRAPVKDAKQLQKETKGLQSKEFKKKMEARQKATRDWVGDNVLGNLDKTVDQLHKLEDMYHHILDKTGMTYIVRAALRCLALDLPIDLDNIKGFLLDARSFTADVMEILKIPVIGLDDLFPTVDIMGDILKQVFLAILEAVGKALWKMLKNIIYTLLDNCNDPCAQSYGGIQIGALLQKGGLKSLGKGLAGPALATAGSAALGGIQTGLASSNLEENSKQFLSTLNKKVSPDQIKTLTAPIAGPVSRATDAASEAFSRSPLGKFFDEASATLTCGETNKLLQGKSSPAAAKIIKSIADKLCEADPTYGVLCELVPDQDSINDFFGSVGKLIDQDELAAQIEEASQVFPNAAGCLSDRQDSELRCFYLDQKDAPDGWCDAQDNASAARAIDRINQLQDLLDDPSRSLQDAVPPIYCSYDPITSKIIDGLVSNDHPSFVSMMHTTLDTTLNGVGNAFTYDVLRVPKAMQLEVPGGSETGGSVEEIPRVIDAREEDGAVAVPRWGGGDVWQMINPRFKLAIQQGTPPDPEFWESQAWDEEPVANPNQWNGTPSTKTPTDGDFADHQRFGRMRTIIWNRNQDALKKSVTTVEFCPGMQTDVGKDTGGVFGSFQTQYWQTTDDITRRNQIARTRLEADRNSMKLSVDNIIKTSLQETSTDLFSTFLDQARHNTELASSLRNAGVGLGELFGPDKYAVQLTNYSGDTSTQDKFAVTIAADYITSADQHIYNKIFDIGINEAARTVIRDRHLTARTSGWESVSTKENHFASFLADIWTEGENIYTGSVGLLGSAEKPSYGHGFVRASARSDGQAKTRIKDALLQDQTVAGKTHGSLYEELLRDLQASCLSQVGKDNKLLDKQYGNIMSLINLVPPPCSNGVDRSLLGLENLKNDITEKYKDALCIENSFPNTTGLGDNRDNAFESATLYGIVVLTTRLYAIEIVLKTLVTFSQLQIDDLDICFIAYVRETMMKEIRVKGYLDDFITQTLKAYKLEVARKAGLSPTTDFTIALDYFIKEQLSYAVEKILKMAGLTDPAFAIDNLLINNFAPSLDRGWLPEFEAEQIPEDIADLPIQAQGSFHVRAKNDIMGIKDWSNGSIILEKYIRLEPTDNWALPDQAYIDPVAELGFGDRLLGVFPLHNDPMFSLPPALTDPNAPDSGDGTNGGNGTTDTTRKVDISVDADCDPLATPVEIEIDLPTTSSPNGSGSGASYVQGTHSGEYFKTFRVGLRLVVTTKSEQMYETVGGGLSVADGGISGNRFDGYRNKSYAFGAWAKESFMFPIVCVERDIEFDVAFGLPGNFVSAYNDNKDELLSMLKSTDEWKFMFDYCFPLKRLVSLSALYNATYVLPYPHLTNVLSNTKEQLRIAFQSMLRSGNYQYNDLPNMQAAQANIIANGGEVPGFDLGLMALQFIFGLGKGLGEAFSPNIAIARKIQYAIEMIGPMIVKAVNTAKDIANKACQKAAETEELACAVDAKIRGEKDLDAIAQDCKSDIDRNCGGDPITECDLPDPPFPIPEIPIILISLGLLPMDLFFPIPGPPLGPIGAFYLAFYHSKIAPGRIILDWNKSTKEKMRCEIDEASGGTINLKPKPEDCNE